MSVALFPVVVVAVVVSVASVEAFGGGGRRGLVLLLSFNDYVGSCNLFDFSYF